MKKTIAVLPGDGIGPEVTIQAVRVLKKIAERFHHNFIFEYGLIGASSIDITGYPLSDETLELCQKSDAILFGAIGDPKYDLDPNAKIRPEQGLLQLRKTLNLYANIRPVKVYEELIDNSPLKKKTVESVDLIVVRELTGGIYFGEPRGRKDNGEKAIDTSIYTKEEITRIAKVAFEQAKKRRRKITSVDKANVLETSRLWRETVIEVSKLYPEVELTHMYIDNAAMQLIKNPKQFDVLLTENMFGDILSDEASIIAGSIGLLPSASIGEEFTLFEPVHGAYNKAVGRNIANPIASILSAVMMIRIAFELEQEATAIENAVKSVFLDGFRTKDLSSSTTPYVKIVGTKEMGKLIMHYL